MKDLKEKLKKSYFFANKLHVLIIFILMSLVDLTLGVYYFLATLIIFAIKTLGSKIPIKTKKDFPMNTYTYKKFENKSLKMDIWYPSANMNKKYPLVFFCHGGGWISGFRNQANNVSWCKFLASKGFCACSIDYRYGLKNTMEDILSDYTDALNFVKKNSKKLNIDKNNIVLMGLSAGGHLSLLYSTYNSYTENKENMAGIKGVVAYYSPSDLKDIFIPENKSVFAKFSAKKTLKGKVEDKKDIYDYYSPIHWMSNRMIPCLIAHGKLDTTVPFSSSEKFVNSLKKNNIYYQFLVHKKGGHSFDTRLKDFPTVNILEKTIRFIKKLTQ